MEKLGKIEMEELRVCWPHEEYDFTPWLAENIDELAKVIGVDSIEIIGTEIPVGKYSADIVGKIDNGHETINIVIENQLEKSDHDHLGKIITYASGLNSKFIVWICKEVEDEHRAAIDWLNENINDGIFFFLIKIELWKIDNSKPALRFNLICSPIEWEKSIRKIIAQPSGIRLDQLKFWTEFQKFLEGKPELKNVFKRKIPKALAENWYHIDISTNKASLECKISFSKGYIRCDLHINTMELYEKLFLLRNEINKDLGLELEWDETLLEKEQETNSVRYYNKNIDLSNENFNDCFEWFYEILMKYLTIIPKYLDMGDPGKNFLV